METFLRGWLPRVRAGDWFEIHAYPGKQALLRHLPARLRAYRRWLPRDHRLVLRVDRDQQDCRDLKQALLEGIAAAGLVAKGSSSAFDAAVRIVEEELEAWFIGEPDALCTAYPRLPSSFARARSFREPDRITGTWEALERLLRRHGYHRGGRQKIELARQVARHFEASRNRSPSFRVFWRLLEELNGAS